MKSFYLFCRTLSAVVFVFLFLSGAAQAERVSAEYVTTELVAEKAHLIAGKENLIGLSMSMRSHWHTYWRYPGDSGLPTKVQWTLPPGWKVSETLWPIPKRIMVPPLVNFGFENEVVLGFQLMIPAGESEGKKQIEAKASWLVCKEECIPEKANLSLWVDVKKNTETKNTAWAKAFADLMQQQPIALPSQEDVRLVQKKDTFLLELSNRSGWMFSQKLEFFPYDGQVLQSYDPATVVATQEGVQLSLKKADPFSETVQSFRGILVVRGKYQNLDRAYEIDLPLKNDAGAMGTLHDNDSPTSIQLLGAIGLAFLGGLLLNLMPCVFPVLGIKVMAILQQSGGSRKKNVQHANVYGFGVLCSFWLLTTILLLLRAAGESVGWGFQLQQPMFVKVMILLFFFMSVSLAGFFEIGGRWMGFGSKAASQDGLFGSFFAGVLAVVVATPCTAPFMGTAIGLVLSQPAWLVFLIFSALALGLAFPFWLLCAVPSLLAFLPRPGVWMERFKEFMAFPMAATVLWLLWVLEKQEGWDVVLAVLLAILSLSFGMWVLARVKGTLTKSVGWLVMLLGMALCFSSGGSGKNEATISDSLLWQPYSEAALAQALSENRPVFIDFTAAWCLTCQVNEKIVLERASMHAFFKEKNIALFKGDWTHQDPVITKALERYGRIGVPLYVAYRAGQTVDQGTVLPQVLSQELLREALSESTANESAE